MRQTRTFRIPLQLWAPARRISESRPNLKEDHGVRRAGMSPVRSTIEAALSLGLMVINPWDVREESLRRGTTPEAVNISGALVARAEGLSMGSVPATIRAALRKGLEAMGEAV